MRPDPARLRSVTAPRRSLAVAALAAGVLAGCGGGAPLGAAPAADPPVRAAEELLAAPPVVEPDPSGTSATIRVTTEVATACAVVYGRDGDVGEGIATDADMGGGAHTDHAAVLTGLEPDTEYAYRLQGSGPDGDLFRSATYTFRTPPAAAAAGGVRKV